MLLNSRQFKFLKNYRNVNVKSSAKRECRNENVFLKGDRALSKLITLLIWNSYSIPIIPILKCRKISDFFGLIPDLTFFTGQIPDSTGRFSMLTLTKIISCSTLWPNFGLLWTFSGVDLFGPTNSRFKRTNFRLFSDNFWIGSDMFRKKKIVDWTDFGRF